MKKLKYFFLFLIIFSTLSSRADDEIVVNVGFKYQDTNLRIEMYEPEPSFVFSVAKTALIRNPKKLPIKAKLKLPVKIKENEFKTFVLVVRNDTDRARYFFAAPHTVHPSHMSLDAIFECLCNHHVYKVPPRMTWYRVVRIKFENEEKNWKGTKKINLDHTVIEVPEAKALKEYRPLLFDQSDSGSEESDQP